MNKTVILGSAINPSFFKNIESVGMTYYKVDYNEFDAVIEDLNIDDINVVINSFPIRKVFWKYLTNVNKYIEYDKKIENYIHNRYTYSNDDRIFMFKLKTKIKDHDLNIIDKINPELLDIWEIVVTDIS